MPKANLYLNERHRLAEKLRGVERERTERLASASDPELSTHLALVGDPVAFLAAAIDGGSLDSFERYALWAAEVLRARSVPTSWLTRHLDTLRGALAPSLSLCEQELVTFFVEAARRACLASPPAPVCRDHSSPECAFLRAILDGNRRGALDFCLKLMEGGLAPLDVYMNVVQRAQAEVGMRWQRGEVDVAAEHIATSATRWVLANLSAQLARDPAGAARRGRVLVCCTERERHELGAQLLADALEADGWEVKYLGGDVPISDILVESERFRPDVVALSTTLSANLPPLIELVRALHERLGEGPGGVRVVVGGAAHAFAPNFWNDVGADAMTPDARAAVNLLRTWGKTG